MTFKVRYTRQAREDLLRLFQYLVEIDPVSARAAHSAIVRATGVLEEFPFTCRKAESSNPLIRELIIPFGSAGYVALFEIENEETVTILAIRHQREDDYFG
ncbi:MAG: type II toxin-antitoxin system RelE/ParE family toxin [Balneolales bacterium]